MAGGAAPLHEHHQQQLHHLRFLQTHGISGTDPNSLRLGALNSLMQQQQQALQHHRQQTQTQPQQHDPQRVSIAQKYKSLGFIAAGTYGRVFKAVRRVNQPTDGKLTVPEFAIKKFKPEKEGDASLQTGISQSACREIALCRELSHINVVYLEEVFVDPLDRSIYMVFEYAEHDLLQILHHHTQITQASLRPIPFYTIKSLLYQLINGVAYLHANWVLHRDLKPANVLVTSKGVVKIGDLGLARIFQKPLRPLYDGDKVVVTIWYRSPELLFSSKHYTPAVDMWAVGCIFAELLMLKPIFKGEEAKMDAKKKDIPFQKDQVQKIIDVLGTPTKKWPLLTSMPEFPLLKTCAPSENHLRHVCVNAQSPPTEQGYQLLASLFEYDPMKRLSADDALKHSYFAEEPIPSMASFHPNSRVVYPNRRLQEMDF